MTDFARNLERLAEQQNAMLAIVHEENGGRRAWRAIRTGGVTGIRLNIGEMRTPDGALVRGRALHAVRIIALDDAPDPGTRVLTTWEESHTAGDVV